MDPGAIGPGGHHEADLALGVSLKFGEMIKEAYPDVKIIYTRTTDKFVSLADRADMANKAKADLFICIHLNSATNHDAYGTSTYVLGLHRTDDNLEIAKRENAVIDLETNKNTKYEFDPNSPEGHIIMSMKQNAFLDQSILIASKIEDELAVLAKRKSRGVKQAGFWVLYKTAMPSLLAEIGFISNPTEEQYLASDAGQNNIATSIFKAFRSYKNDIEGRKDTIEPVAKATPAPEKKKDEPVLTDTPPSAQKAQPAASPTKQPAPEPKANPVPVAEAKSQPAPAAEAKQQPAPTAAAALPEAKKEEKAWEPDTADVAPAPQVFREQQAVANTARIDQIAQPVMKDTVKPAATTDPRKTAPENTQVIAPVPKAEATKPAPVVAAKTVKPAAGDTIRKIEVRTATPKTPAATTTVKAKTDTVKAVLAKEPKQVAKETATTAIKKEQPVVAKETPAKKETTPAKKETPAVVEKKEPAKKETPAVAEKKEPVKKETTAKKETPASKGDALATDNDNVIFTVQIVAAHKAPANYDDLVSAFGLINREDIGDGVVRYMAGQYTHYREAEKTLQIAKSKGFTTAFVVAYVNNVRQTVAYTKEIGAKHP